MPDFPSLPVAGLVVALISAGLPSGGTAAATALTVTIDLGGGPVNGFTPETALGAGVDGHARGDIAAIYRPATLRAMRSVGLRPLTYRLRTELGIEAWHWNPNGSWSDGTQGYWTSDDRPAAPILESYGYRLPRRGNTIDQANDDGYSRLADGDLDTFWKSNPYLDSRYTGEDNRLHPQWLIADLGQPTAVDAMRIVWGIPFATRYRVQYWQGEEVALPDGYPAGQWQTFPAGEVTHEEGGDRTLRLAGQAVVARYLRVLLEESSNTAPAGATDPRDALGYAVREVYVGTLEASGEVHDALRHAASRDGQSHFFVSSTDPWHRAVDLDPAVEQAGIDRVYASGLTHALPMLVPVGVLYDTPENAAALLRYLRRRGHAVRGVELGEEPDGQYVAPEDYGTLYLQTADALRAVDPEVPLGGPSFQSLWEEPMMACAGTAVGPDQPWLARLLHYLRERGRLSDLAFLSFEWYPFDDVCAAQATQLQRAPGLLTESLANLHRQGLPRSTPLLMSEYGYSAFATPAEVDLAGALFNADAVGTFLTEGGSTAYLYGYEPSPLDHEPERKCDTWGNNALFVSDHRRRILARTASYHGARLLAREWAGQPNARHRVYRARVDADFADEQAGASEALPLSAYALLRPDGRWAVLLVNKDEQRAWKVSFRFARGEPDAPEGLHGPADVYQFSAAQYVWRANGEHGRPRRSRSPRHLVLAERVPVSVPPWSLTVVRSAGPVAALDESASLQPQSESRAR